MFKPVKLKKLRAFVLSEKLQLVLDKLHKNKLIQIVSVKSDENLNELSEAHSAERSKFSGYELARVKKTISFLELFADKKNILDSVKGFLFNDVKVREEEPVSFDELKNLVEENLSPVFEETSRLESELRMLNESADSINEELIVLNLLSSLDVEASNISGYRNLSVMVGKIALENEDALKKIVSAQENSKIHKCQGEAEKIVLVSVEKNSEDLFLKKLRGIGFERIFVPEFKGKTNALISKNKKELESLELKKLKLEERARALRAENLRKLFVISEFLEAEKNKAIAFNSFLKTNSVMLFDFFVPVKESEKVSSSILNEAQGLCVLEEISFKDEDAPVILSNPPFIRNYEMLLELFGLPEYNGIDPTFFIALLYPLFFGLAFSDLGYGILLIILGLFLRETIGKKSVSNKRLATIILHGGILTSFFGWLFGSFFGNFLGPSFKAALFDPMGSESALVFIGAILGLGLIHINIALFLGSYDLIRKKLFKRFFYEKIPWFFLQLSVFLIFLNMLFGLSEMFLYFGAFYFIVTLALLLKGSGVMGLMGISSFSGNVLSYLRLLALSFATFSIALAINEIVKLVALIPFVGILLAPLVLIVAHFANFLFNILGSFVHALRLNFVEFFGYFYEGGGKKFEPFYTERKYTKIGGEK
ncbi:MAG: V-type ATP synthase subunit I [Candidatus Diapherotrites archaeon]